MADWKEIQKYRVLHKATSPEHNSWTLRIKSLWTEDLMWVFWLGCGGVTATENPWDYQMCNNPLLCELYCRDYHVELAFDGDAQREKRDEGIVLQVNSRESLEEGKKIAQLLSAMVISLLWLCYETPPPAVAHICHPLLRRHNIFSLRRTYGTSKEWSVI